MDQGGSLRVLTNDALAEVPGSSLVAITRSVFFLH